MSQGVDTRLCLPKTAWPPTLSTSSENLTSAESRIRDVDMAKEMSTFSKNNILSQAAQAMLSQANQQVGS